MAIQVNGTQVVGNSRELTNITSIDATTASAINAAGVGGNIAMATLSGTSPTGNLSSHTDFTQSLTGDTSVSFSSIPTGAKWEYFWNGGLNPSAYSNLQMTADGLTGVVKDMNATTAAAKDSITSGSGTGGAAIILSSFGGTIYNLGNAAMNEAGTILLLYAQGTSGYRFNRYNLSTANDLSTLSYDSSRSVNTIAATPTSANKSEFGGRGYWAGDQFVYQTSGITGQKLLECRFTTPWDPSTVVYSVNYSTASYGAYVYSFTWRHSDGLRYWYTDGSSQTWQMNCSSAFQIHTTTSSTNLGSIGLSYADYVKYSQNGKKAYVYNAGSWPRIRVCNVSTPWDPTTADFSTGGSTYINVGSASSNKLYTMGDNGQVIFRSDSDNQYYLLNLAGGYPVTFPQVSTKEYTGGPNRWSKASFSTFNGGSTIFDDVVTNIQAG